MLRAWLAGNGYAVLKEIAVKDTRLYTVMQVRYSGEPYALSETESYIGRLRRSDPLTRVYLAGVLDRLHTKAHGLADAGQDEAAMHVRSLISGINAWMAGENK